MGSLAALAPLLSNNFSSNNPGNQTAGSQSMPVVPSTSPSPDNQSGIPGGQGFNQLQGFLNIFRQLSPMLGGFLGGGMGAQKQMPPGVVDYQSNGQPRFGNQMFGGVNGGGSPGQQNQPQMTPLMQTPDRGLAPGMNQPQNGPQQAQQNYFQQLQSLKSPNLGQSALNAVRGGGQFNPGQTSIQPQYGQRPQMPQPVNAVSQYQIPQQPQQVNIKPPQFTPRPRLKAEEPTASQNNFFNPSSQVYKDYKFNQEMNNKYRNRSGGVTGRKYASSGTSVNANNPFSGRSFGQKPTIY